MASREEWQRLQAIADRSEIQLTKEFLQLLRTIATIEVERRLVAALRRRQIQVALEIVRQAMAPATAVFQTALTNELMRIQEKAFVVAGDHLGIAKLTGSFDLTNPEAVNFASTRGSQFVATLDTHTRAMLRATISSSFIEGIPPRETAALIRESIGLTANQATAIDNYRKFLAKLGQRDSLDALPPSVRERVARSDMRILPKKGSSLTEERVDKMVTKYRDRLVRERALTLVRTETMAASNNGQQVLWNKAVDQGLLKETTTRKKFIVTPDDRLCPICKPMAGQLRRLDESFVSPYNGATVRTPPVHFKCRCAMGLVRVRQQNGATA